MINVRDYLVRDVMSTPVLKVLPMVTVREGAEMMLNRRVGSLVVVTQTDSLIGIVTKSDIIARVVAKGLNPDEVRVGDIMTRNPIYIFADDSIERAVDLMSSHRIGHLPVLDPETNKPIGMLSKWDIVRLSPEYIRGALFGGLIEERGE